MHVGLDEIENQCYIYIYMYKYIYRFVWQFMHILIIFPCVLCICGLSDGRNSFDPEWAGSRALSKSTMPAQQARPVDVVAWMPDFGSRFQSRDTGVCLSLVPELWAFSWAFRILAGLVYAAEGKSIVAVWVGSFVTSIRWRIETNRTAFEKN